MTAGANGGINWFYTPSGFYVSFSGQQALTPAGRELQGTGVVPDVIVRPTVRHLVEGRDAVLERALELVAAP